MSRTTILFATLAIADWSVITFFAGSVVGEMAAKGEAAEIVCTVSETGPLRLACTCTSATCNVGKIEMRVQ